MNLPMRILILNGLALICAQLTLTEIVIADERASSCFRRPVALAIADDGRHLLVANQRSGTVSLLDLRDNKVLQEYSLGKRLSDLVVTESPDEYLATDEETHELIAFHAASTGGRVIKRVKVSPYPVNVRLNRDRSRAFVTSLWSRTLTIVDLAAWKAKVEHEESEIKRLIRLPFSPRELLVLDDIDLKTRIPDPSSIREKLVVADAFGSRLAVIDTESGEIDSVREIPGHAIRNLQLHPSKPQLMVAHQLLNRVAQSTFEDVHWGTLMVNVLRSIDLSDLLDPNADLLNRSLLEYLGGPDRGAGDPAGFVMRSDGVTGIVLSGTDELIIHDENHVYSGRVSTEHYPTAIAIGSDGKRAYVLNTLSDSVSVIRLSGPVLDRTISLGPHPELTAVDRGERLFHSAKLSHDNWFSCASCHVHGHTNGLLNDNMTDGTFGTAKRVLTLRGIGQTAPYAWNGKFKTLEDQISHSIRSTMQGSALPEDEISDLVAYLKTLPPPPAIGCDDKESVERGSVIFEAQNCRKCHSLPALTSAKIVNVGLKDERGNSLFNPPSLRGVSQNAPYVHDGRATSLESLFRQFRHQLDRELSNGELSDLVSYLNTL